MGELCCDHHYPTLDQASFLRFKVITAANSLSRDYLLRQITSFQFLLSLFFSDMMLYDWNIAKDSQK